MGYPEDVLVAGEQLVVHARPHPKVLLGPAIAFVLVVGLGGWLAGQVDGIWAWLLVGLVVVLVGWLTVVPVLRWRTTHLVVTTRRVLVREGILTRTGVDLPVNRITSAGYHSTVFERIFGCGTLTIESAAEEPLVVDDVPDVAVVHAALYQEVAGG